MTAWGRGCEAYHGRHVASVTTPIRAPAIDGHAKAAPYTGPDDEPRRRPITPTSALPNDEGSSRRDKNCQFWKHLKIFGIVCIDSLNAIGLHGRDNLQIEYVTTRYGTAAKQSDPRFHGVDRDGQHMKKRQQTGNRTQCVGRRARLGNAPRIGDYGIKLAEDLRGHIKSCGRVSGSVEQGA
jgi:hypothetical protein